MAKKDEPKESGKKESPPKVKESTADNSVKFKE